MSEIKFRPHHALCVTFFEGKGYSDKFTENMYSVIRTLEAEDPVLTLTAGADIICGSCPNNNGGVCASAEKAERYDSSVLDICGLSAGDSIKWSGFHSCVKGKIISSGRLKEVCGDCRWQYICSRKLSPR